VVVIDAGPLIFLAKLDALVVLDQAHRVGLVPASVWEEVARPELAFRHPEVAVVERARDEGWLEVVDLTEHERARAEVLASRLSGLHRGELECLALAQGRVLPVCLHERQASRLARTLGVDTIHVIELLFEGTPDPDLLADRVRHFGRLTNLAMTDLDALLESINERRP
jgi:predicted nucleic acid-binding protein